MKESNKELVHIFSVCLTAVGTGCLALYIKDGVVTWYAAFASFTCVYGYKRWLELDVKVYALELNRAKLELEMELLEQRLRHFKTQPSTHPFPAQFTPQELKRIRILCHPDKHGGSKMATEMSAILNRRLS